MEMSYNTFKEILGEYQSTLVMTYDVLDALDFVAELLEAEADAVQLAYPYATNQITRLNDAAREVRQLGYGVSDALADNGEVE